MRIGTALLLGATLWMCAGGRPAAAQAAAQKSGNQPPPSELLVTTRVDKTAVWVGDQLHYQITVDHAPELQFVLENLNKDTIRLDPLRVVEVTPSTIDLKSGRKRLFVDVTLANFTTGVASIEIPQLTLFYFRREGAGAAPANGGAAAAESVTIPGPVIGIRSTLPPDPSDLRDAVTVTRWPRSRRAAAVLGWCALLVLVAGVGWEGARLIRSRKGRRGPDPRKAMNAVRERWSRAVPADFSDPAVVRDFYGRSYQDLKEYLGYLLETSTEGLTAEDLREELRRLSADPELAEKALTVLAACEAIPYLRSGTEPIGDPPRAVAREIEEIFEAGSRT